MIWQTCMENESHISNTFIYKINLYAFTCICHVISCRLQNELSLFVSVVLNIITEKTEIIHNLLSAQLICSKRNAFDRQMSNDCMVTVGSLNADILRYNADNLSITLKLWGKLDENVSWVNTFPSHSPISIHFTRQNIAYRCVNACDSTDAFNAHSVISRKRLPQTCDNTDTGRSAPVLRKLSISAGLSKQCSWRIFVSIVICFHFWVYRTYSIVFILLQKLNFCCRWTQHWKCEVRFSLSLSFAGAISRLRLRKRPD